ncbi:glucose-1-phosphate thymidylyltransferase [Flavobacteriaceae bacterium UJ101]|nr:glucose-1-phosphate thymidylyltransferase [Flavobacteriaceae bacterium UJ101]
MNYILFDGPERDHLLPLTFTRPVGELRTGILTIKEKWEIHLGLTCSYLTQEYLSKKYPMVDLEDNILINASFLPTEHLVEQIKNLKEKQALMLEDDIIALYTHPEEEIEIENFEVIEYNQELIHIERPFHLFSYNHQTLQDDFDLLTKGRQSQPISDTNRVINPENIFIEEGAEVEFSILNASTGPIYIGKNAKILEGCLVRGGLALCENSQLNMGAKIYGAVTIGPFSKIGGEVNNSVLTGYSSKGHEGYLGNAVLGEWCNLGADTNNSNLKNDYSEVKLWNYATNKFEKTGLQFCGLIMGDHSKCAINTQFNTGTVVGVCANIFEAGFPKNMIPSFTWGSSSEYRVTKAHSVAKKVMIRRNVEFNELDAQILEYVFEETAESRNLFIR